MDFVLVNKKKLVVVYYVIALKKGFQKYAKYRSFQSDRHVR